MISALNLKLSKIALVIIVLFNLVVAIVLMEYFWNLSKIDYSNTTNWKEISGYFNKEGYKPAKISTPGLEGSGYVLEPGNVQFKFINPKAKSGSPEKILQDNDYVYQEMFKNKITEPKDMDIETIRPPDPEKINSYQRANATIIALVRNSEVSGIGRSIQKFEKSFNGKFKYPYTFINDAPFSDKFKAKMRKFSDAPMEFVEIPRQLWDKPSFIDSEKEKSMMLALARHNVAYAMKPSYHNMCRFYSGNFYNVPELQKYKYYWRIEPDVKFYSDIRYDIFKYLQGTGKVYGFTVNLYDIDETLTTLWPETLKYLNEDDNFKYVNENGAFQWLLENQQNPKKNANTGGYSTCHFWSNFEIGDMDFFRGEAYNKWFQHLDQSGGFYYERWGDAPVHSMGLALFADKSKIHWFRDIGYFHDPYLNCPNSDSTKNCKIGTFSRWKHLNDQNCMGSWIDYSMEGMEKVY
ncbi:putative mannosyltransferase ktr4 [Yamadazyma tenuis]|nr:putative mannosyltransferase ktr4 [Yamadazyma tenuis]